MMRYRCGVCGYVYDPSKGDESRGIGAGTPFEDLPDDWVCPICGAPKSAFYPLEDEDSMEW
ncbi:MAG: rubredoxin [Candidatus Korarchaeota archaeon NZ13-K]|nr:MAG: rubredoxin [Candidatus Korarchaeota archaeon NZ13-K]